MSKKQFEKSRIPRQGDLFAASASWFHMFKSMVECGDIAVIGTTATAVYLVIKSYTNFSTGHAFPSLELIAEKSGLSKRQVMRELKTLEEHGYITVEKQGRSNLYTLREKIQIHDSNGRPTAVATFDYLPDMVKDATAELRRVLMTGDFDGAKIIQIQSLNMIVGDNNTQTVSTVSFDDALTAFEKLADIDPDMRARLLSIANNVKSRGDDKNQ